VTTDNNIVGEVMVALDHELLKEMEVESIGHRLMILKSIYDIKVSQEIPFESDHYVPLSMLIEFYFIHGDNANFSFIAADDGTNINATRADLTQIKEMIRVRDERIIQVEKDLRKITDEYRKLREEFLPIVKMAKDRSQPLPPTGLNGGNSNNNQGYQQHNGFSSLKQSKPPAIMTETKGGLTRKLSTRNNLYSTQKQSPTQIPIEAPLDPSAAAMAASTHLTSSMAGAVQHATIPSPTSPSNVPQTAPLARSYQTPSLSRNNTHDRDTHESLISSTSNLGENNNNSSNNRSASGGTNNSGSGGRSGGRHYVNTAVAANSTSNPNANGQSTPEPPHSAGLSGKEPSVEIFKSFRVSMDDPCYKVLPAALKQYKIDADWRTYALYIVYGDQERCLGLDEKPLTLFKQLMHEKKKPMFMLRKTGATEGEPLGPGLGVGIGAGGGSGGQVQIGGGGGGARYGSQGSQGAVPGGVL
jgi:hypothetical protein